MELPVFQSLLCSKNTILTQITGDSMTGDGLMPGDIVLCEKKKRYCSGQIVICIVAGHTMPLIKRIYYKCGCVFLRSSNSQYDDYVTERCKVTVLAQVKHKIHISHLA